MASVLLSDVIIPEVYLSYTAVDTPELTAFLESGVVFRDPLLDNAWTGGGQTVHLPFWKDLDSSSEPNYSTDQVTDVAVPDKITADVMIARVGFLNKAYSAADLIMQLAGSNPMQRIRNRFGAFWSRQFQHRLLKSCLGIYADNVANENGDMILNIASEDGNNASAANLFSRQAFTGAIFTLGDHFGGIAAIAVHSVVFKRMVDNDDIEFRMPSEPDPNIPLERQAAAYYLGKRVIIDDGMPVTAGGTSGYKFTSILFGQGAIGYGEYPAPVPVEVYRRPDQGNGGGVDQLWERKTWAIHPYGYKFTSASVAGITPTLAEMATAANWTRLIDRKLIPIAFLVTNG